MKDRTLVKVKIVLEDDGASLVSYFWKKTWWIFGYWYPYGCSSTSGGHQPDEKLNRIIDENVSRVLFKNFIKGLK